MKRWSWLEWLLFGGIIPILALMATPYPRWLHYFLVANDGLIFLGIFICVGLGCWMIKISQRRHDELLADAYDSAASYEGEDFVGWYYMWKEEGLSDDDLINCFIGKPVPPALKKELERQGKKIIIKPDFWE